MPASLSANTQARQHLLDMARQLFAARGFHAVSLRELAQAVGLQAGSLYSHIHSKEALLEELIEEGYEQLIDSAQLRLRRAEPGKALAAFLRHHLTFKFENSDWYVLASLESRHLNGEAQHELQALKVDYAALLERLLKARLAGRGESRRVAAVARQTLCLLDGPPDSDGMNLDDWIEDLERLLVDRLRR
nr:TetR/AcrR family transcriptional regulator [uncultured Pseudomonas sp.]